MNNILTGKTKDDFLKWTKQGNLVNVMADVYLHALIVEWFDSVGIIIEIVATYYDGWTFMPVVYDTFGNKHDIDIDFKQRQEATKQAILKANDVYNKQF